VVHTPLRRSERPLETPQQARTSDAIPLPSECVYVSVAGTGKSRAQEHMADLKCKLSVIYFFISVLF